MALQKASVSPWLHFWTATDQIKANAILAVLQCGTLHRQIILGLGFKLSPGWGHAQDHSKCENRTWSEPTHFQPQWKLTIRRKGEWYGAFSTSCIRQIKNKCLPGTMLLANMSLSSVWGQLWNTDSWYSQDRWDGVKSPSSYELWIEETQIVYGYPRYLNGHLRWHVP